MESKFGLGKDSTIWDKYTKEKPWIILKSQNYSEIGRFDRIENGFVILNPYEGMKNNREILVEEDAGMRLDLICSYRITDKETILAHCEEYNKKLQSE